MLHLFSILIHFNFFYSFPFLLLLWLIALTKTSDMVVNVSVKIKYLSCAKLYRKTVQHYFFSCFLSFCHEWMLSFILHSWENCFSHLISYYGELISLIFECWNNLCHSLWIYTNIWNLCTNILLMIFLSSWGIFSIVLINTFIFVINLSLLFYNESLFLEILLASALFMTISDIGGFNKMAPPPSLFFEKYWKHKGNILLFFWLIKILHFWLTVIHKLSLLFNLIVHNMRRIK